MSRRKLGTPHAVNGETDRKVARAVLAAVRLGGGATFTRKLPPMPQPGRKRTSRRRRARYFVRIGAGKFELSDQHAWDSLRGEVRRIMWGTGR